MRLLLDTHIWLWSLLAPERLTDSVRSALTADGTELWLSPVSVCEALLLAERGRIHVAGDPQRWVTEMLRAVPRREAALTHEVAMTSRTIALAHDDPADRFIAATARVYDLTLVTADERLLSLPEIARLANR